MKYREFKLQLCRFEATVQLVKGEYVVKDRFDHTLAVIDGVEKWCASSRYTSFKELQLENRHALMAMIMKFAGTSIENRYDETLYYVHMRTTGLNFTEYSYLTLEFKGNFYRQGTKQYSELNKNQFTKKEIEQIRIEKKIDEVTWNGMVRLQEVMN